MFEFLENFSVGGIVETLLSVVSSLAKVLAPIFTQIAQVLGVIGSETNAEELGCRAILAEKDGISPDNFDSYEEYVSEITASDIDENKASELDEEEKLQKGIEVTSALILEKDPENMIVDFVRCIANYSDYFTAEKTTALYSIAKDNPEVLDKIHGYLSGEEKNIINNREALNTLIQVEKEANPSLSTNEALENIEKAER